MNQCGFRHVKCSGQYHAEYRLAEWGGWRKVRLPNGEPIAFEQDYQAALCAAANLVKGLNSEIRAWRGSNGDEARKAAERLFSRDTGTPPDESSNQSGQTRQTTQTRDAGA